MPKLSDIIRTARMPESDYHNPRRAGKFDAWPSDLSEAFAVRLGLFAALRAAGKQVHEAIEMAEELLANPPRLLFLAPREGSAGREIRDFRGQLADESLSEIRRNLAEQMGRIVLSDGPPDHELDKEPEADFVIIIDVHAVIDRMKALYQ